MTSTATGVRDTDGENLPGFEGCDVLCEKVFANGLIFRKLEKMLSYSDLKLCRLVCRRFNCTISNETGFGTRTTFVLNEETCRVKILENIGFTLKQVEVHPFYSIMHGNLSNRKYATADKTDLTEDDVEHVYEKLKEVESIRWWGVRLSHEKAKLCMPSLQRVIQGATNLKKLALNEFEFSCEGLFDMSWANLVDFEINIWQYDMWKSYAVMSSAPLKRLTIIGRYRKFLRDSEMGNIETFVALVTQNQATVEFLRLDEPHLWKVPSILTTPAVPKTVFPKLCELHMSVLEVDAFAEEVSVFLKTHLKQLHALSVRVLGELPSSLLDLIQVHAAQFKKLSIKAITFEKSTQPKLAFLADCNILKEFKHHFISTNTYERHGDSLADVFSYIPTSVRKLSLFTKSESDTLSIAKIQMLSKLSSLKLFGCWDAVTNEILQAIFMNMTSLRKLKITEARKCTDEGFTGTSDDGTAKENTIPISNLKLLTSLTLVNCGITDRTVKEGIRFIDLLKLDISANSGITSACIEMALGNNPALETLRTYEFPDFKEPDDIQPLKKSYPRFKDYQIGGEKWKRTEEEMEIDDSDNEGWISDSESNYSGVSLSFDDTSEDSDDYDDHEDDDDEDDEDDDDDNGD